VGIGGDPVVGLSFRDVLMQFESDRDTQVVVLVGEIGGSAEEDACEMIEQMTKPVVAYIAGKTAPAGTRMGHAGAIIERGRGGYEQKVAALRRAGAQVVPLAQEVSNEVRRLLGERAVKEEEH
jgi:succinyl-CoA synthetase alpha subunit